MIFTVLFWWRYLDGKRENWVHKDCPNILQIVKVHVDQPWQRPRKLGDFKGVDQFEAKFSVEGLRFAPMSTDRYTGKWLYYNFATGSFHTKKLCSRLCSIEIEFNLKQKKQKIAFWANLWELGGNARTPPVARWKARSRLPIRHIGLFSLSLTVETL